MIERALRYARIFFFITVPISFAVIAYSHYEIMKAEKVQAVALVKKSDNAVNGFGNITSFNLLMAGFSIEEIYTSLYSAQHLPSMAESFSK